MPTRSDSHLAQCLQETALLMLHLLKLLQANKNKDCGLKPFDAIKGSDVKYLSCSMLHLQV